MERPFIAGFIDLQIGLVEQMAITKWHAMCSDLISFLTRYRISEMTDDVCIESWIDI